jgi:hypothetical protein
MSNLTNYKVFPRQKPLFFCAALLWKHNIKNHKTTLKVVGSARAGNRATTRKSTGKWQI